MGQSQGSDAGSSLGTSLGTSFGWLTGEDSEANSATGSNGNAGSGSPYKGKVHFYPHDQVIDPTLSSMASSTGSSVAAVYGSMIDPRTGRQALASAAPAGYPGHASVSPGGRTPRSSAPTVMSDMPGSAASLARATGGSPDKRGGIAEPRPLGSAPLGSAPLGSALLLKAPDMQEELRQRKGWGPGAVVEVFSGTFGRWLVALVTKVSEDRQSVVVQFCSSDGAPLMKTLLRSDVQLAVFGSHTNELPPNVREVPSQTRPGQTSYLDQARGLKFAALDDAWRSHFEQLMAKWQKEGRGSDKAHR
eukprot:gb/GFBE01070203.1/.p1 GENE.gb/GFBE01070203.1/~~gb/GFBE01070203.1/.p1  ORF type:complete len:304 (+),score=34.62 gb/GFBE01070203.1/:1-912(+)